MERLLLLFAVLQTGFGTWSSDREQQNNTHRGRGNTNVMLLPVLFIAKCLHLKSLRSWILFGSSFSIIYHPTLHFIRSASFAEVWMNTVSSFCLLLCVRVVCFAHGVALAAFSLGWGRSSAGLWPVWTTTSQPVVTRKHSFLWLFPCWAVLLQGWDYLYL